MTEPLPDAPITAAAHSERRVIMRLRDWADEIADAAGDVVFTSTAYETVLAVLRKARDDGAVAAAPAPEDDDRYQLGRTAEREHIRAHADNRFAGWYVVRADLLDGTDAPPGKTRCDFCGGVAPGHALACPHYAGTITKAHAEDGDGDA